MFLWKTKLCAGMKHGLQIEKLIPVDPAFSLVVMCDF